MKAEQTVGEFNRMSKLEKSLHGFENHLQSDRQKKKSDKIMDIWLSMTKLANTVILIGAAK